MFQPRFWFRCRTPDDEKFAEALLREGIDAMLSGDVNIGETILRDYIKVSVGFEKRARWWPLTPVRRASFVRRLKSISNSRAT